MRPSEPESAPQKGEPQVQASAEAAGEMAVVPCDGAEENLHEPAGGQFDGRTDQRRH